MLRGASSVFIRASHARLATVPALRLTCRAAAPRRLPAAVQFSAPAVRRAYASSAPSSRVVESPARVVEYDEVKALLAKNDPDTIILDVREPDEFEAGHLPNAVNMPFKSMPGALGLDPAEFEATLGFPKPDPSKTLLFYCLGGVRSSASEQLAATYGYTNRINYKGSYADWIERSEAKN